MIYKQKGWSLLQDNFNQLLQLVGYEKMNEILGDLLKNLKK
jgi:hypothetical protein